MLKLCIESPISIDKYLELKLNYLKNIYDENKNYYYYSLQNNQEMINKIKILNIASEIKNKKDTDIVYDKVQNYYYMITDKYIFTSNLYKLLVHKSEIFKDKTKQKQVIGMSIINKGFKQTNHMDVEFTKIRSYFEFSARQFGFALRAHRSLELNVFLRM